MSYNNYQQKKDYGDGGCLFQGQKPDNFGNVYYEGTITVNGAKKKAYLNVAKPGSKHSFTIKLLEPKPQPVGHPQAGNGYQPPVQGQQFAPAAPVAPAPAPQYQPAQQAPAYAPVQAPAPVHAQPTPQGANTFVSDEIPF